MTKPWRLLLLALCGCATVKTAAELAGDCDDAHFAMLKRQFSRGGAPAFVNVGVSIGAGGELVAEPEILKSSGSVITDAYAVCMAKRAAPYAEEYRGTAETPANRIVPFDFRNE